MSRVFSDFEVDQIGIKFLNDEASTYQVVECIGSSEEELESKVITKSCRGAVVKKIVRGTGNGTVKLSLHIPYDIYTKFYGMTFETLLEGVKAYGRNSRHNSFSMTQHVTDEDGNVKYKAYPNCLVETGKTSKIDNGAEEVAEIELEVSILPDAYGNGVYEALDADLKDTTAKETWMTAFTPELVQVKSA